MAFFVLKTIREGRQKMKKQITAILVLLLSIIGYAQNTDKSSDLMTSQKIDNAIFEKKIEAIRTTFVNQVEFITATINNGTALSDSINLGDSRLIAIIMPNAWTTANLTFQAYSANTTTLVNCYLSDGTELSCNAAASRWIIVKQTDFAGIQKFKIRSGTSTTPVNQEATRSLILVIRRY